MNRVYLWVLATGFWILETAHFGWNFFPQSDAEVICDGIVLLLIFFAVVPLQVVIDKNINQIHISASDIEAALTKMNQG